MENRDLSTESVVQRHADPHLVGDGQWNQPRPQPISPTS